MFFSLAKFMPADAPQQQMMMPAQYPAQIPAAPAVAAPVGGGGAALVDHDDTNVHHSNEHVN